EDAQCVETADALAQQCGGGTLFVFRPDPPRGCWWDQGGMDQDVLALLEIDVPDTAASRAWLQTSARDVLCARFRQKATSLKVVRPVGRPVFETRSSCSSPSNDWLVGHRSEQI